MIAHPTIRPFAVVLAAAALAVGAVGASLAEPSPAGLVAAYSFDEATGSTVRDASGNGNDGTVSGATRTTAGRYGRGLGFDGSNDLVTVPDAASLDLSRMTLEAWIRPTSTSGWRTVLAKETSGGSAYSLFASSSTDRPRAYVGGTSAVGGSRLPVDRWMHLATTYDGATIRLYVNGSQVASRSLTGSIAASTAPLRIGGTRVWSSRWFRGVVDEVRVYDRALSASELRTNMSTPVGDAEAPSAPTGLAVASRTTTSVSLSWNAATDNVGVAGYRVYRDGTVVGTTTSLAYSVAGLTCATAYTLGVEAYDAAGNTSSRATLSGSTAACAPPSSGEYFATLPVGSTVPRSDADCTGRVTRNPWEPRPENEAANRNVPSTAVPWNNTSAWTYWRSFIAKRDKVTGNFTGTTDEIIQWAACKWGIDEDVIRAAAVQESSWRQAHQGDYENGRYRSFGLLQIRHDDATGALVKGGHPATLEHTALNVDYFGAEMRACFEGDFYDGGPWLYGGTQVRGDLWGCLGYWYSGNWHTAAAKAYIAQVQGHVATKPWVAWGYPGKGGQADLTAPTAPGSPSVSNPSQTSLTLTWSASSDDVGVAGYRAYRAGSLVGTTTSLSYAFAGLTCGTAYTLAVEAFDAAGNTSARPSVSGTTAACSDTSPPTAPGSLAVANASQTSLTLSWSASSDNVGVAGYRAYRGGSPVGTTTSRSHGFSGLACGTAYTLAVEAFDAAGNTSPRPSVTGTTTACSGGGTASGLRVQGNKLVDASANVVTLRGVNRAGPEYACVQGWGVFEGPTDAASVRALQAWNINVVHIGLNESCVLGINGVASAYSGANYMNAIVAYVNLLHQHGIYAEVSLMWAAPGTQKATGHPRILNQDHSADALEAIANTFGNDPMTIIGLQSEPHEISWACWQNGGSSCSVGYAALGMQGALDAVRSTGATNVVTVSGIDYANNLSQWLTYRPQDPLGQLMAEAHVYGKNVCSSKSCFDASYAPVAGSVPVIFGEFGETYDSSSCGSANTAVFLDWADAHGVSYAAWTWNIWGGCLDLITNYDGTAASSAYASFVRNRLLSHPSTQGPDTTPPVVSADPRGGVFGPGQTVKLTANEPATVYFTLDGSTPTTSSAVYASGLTLNATTKLSFFAVDAAGNKSAVSSETYTIDTSLPALSIEAETMRLIGGYGNPVSNSSASGGQALYVWNVDTATISVTTPTATRITVRAYGTNCDGAPNMVVKVDGAVALDANVTSSTVASYTGTFAVAAGSHTITVSYTNEYASDTCNRNLWVDRIDLHT